MCYSPPMSPFQNSPGAAIRTAAERIRVCRTFPGTIARRYDEPVIVEPLPRPKRPSIAVGHLGPRAAPLTDQVDTRSQRDDGKHHEGEHEQAEHPEVHRFWLAIDHLSPTKLTVLRSRKQSKPRFGESTATSVAGACPRSNGPTPRFALRGRTHKVCSSVAGAHFGHARVGGSARLVARRSAATGLPFAPGAGPASARRAVKGPAHRQASASCACVLRASHPSSRSVARAASSLAGTSIMRRTRPTPRSASRVARPSSLPRIARHPPGRKGLDCRAPCLECRGVGLEEKQATATAKAEGALTRAQNGRCPSRGDHGVHISLDTSAGRP